MVSVDAREVHHAILAGPRRVGQGEPDAIRKLLARGDHREHPAAFELHLDREPDPATAEFAIVVADLWQGKGLGVILMDRLERCAAEAGIRNLTGLILASNAPMLHLMRERGYVIESVRGDASVVQASLALPRKPAA